jgi:hypothetical protein
MFRLLNFFPSYHTCNQMTLMCQKVAIKALVFPFREKKAEIQVMEREKKFEIFRTR